MIVLVLMMAVTVEALIEYAKTFGKAIIEKQWKTAATQAGAVAGHCAYGRLCQPRRELCERPCEEVAGVGRGEN